MSPAAKRWLGWSTVAIPIVALIGAAMYSWSDLTGSRRTLATAACAVAATLLITSVLVKNRVEDVAVEATRIRDRMNELVANVLDVRARVIDGYPSFVETITNVLRSANDRFWIVRAHHHEESAPQEDDYFDLAVARLSEKGSKLRYRRIVNISSKDGLAHLHRNLDRFARFRGAKIWGWANRRFPLNFELIIGDDCAVLAFPEGESGPPGFALVLQDKRIVDRLAELYRRITDDPDALELKATDALTGPALEAAKCRAREAHEKIAEGAGKP